MTYEIPNPKPPQLAVPVTTELGAVYLCDANGNPVGASQSAWSATSGTTALATNSSTTVQAAGATGIRNYLSALQVVNTATAVGTTISILDGSMVIWTGYLPEVASGTQPVPLIVQFPVPLSGTAATAMNIQAGTTSANIYWSAQGYQGT